MTLLRKALLGTAALLIGAATAMAAELVILPPPAPPPPVAPIAALPFGGPYWGSYAGYARFNPQGQGYQAIVLGTQSGYNFGGGNFRYGVEVETEYLRPQGGGVISPVINATLNGRAGVVLNDRTFIYGQGGIGTLLNVPIWAVGGGAEFMLGPSLALFAEGKVYFFLPSAGTGIRGWSIRSGVNYYAGTENLDANGDFDWGGLYLGGVGGFLSAAPPVALYGVQVGYNFGNALVGGVEVETTHPAMPLAIIEATLNARAGFAFGRALVYAEAGIGVILSQPVATAGAGIELALGERLGLFVEAERIFPLNGAMMPLFRVLAGANVHFGR